MRKSVIAATLALCAASAVHAIPMIIDTEAPDATYVPPAKVGPVYIFGTHNTKMTVLVLDPVGSKLCSPALTNCRPAYGLQPLHRATQLQVGQLLKWDRSGMFGLNTTEMIACFQYFDGPGAANFSCATAARPIGGDYVLSQALTAFAWRAYTGAGLAPQSASRATALRDKRKTMTAYAIANGTLPPDRMKAMETEDTVVPIDTPGTIQPPDPPEVELELVNVIGSKPREEPTPVVSGVTQMPNITIVPVGSTLPKDPAIVLNPCVSFQVCAEPPPPPPPEAPNAPPKVCKQQCNDHGTVMSATCNATGAWIGASVAIVVPVGTIVVSYFGTPVLGATFFKVGGSVGTLTAGAYTGACHLLNQSYQQACLVKATQNGC